MDILTFILFTLLCLLLLVYVGWLLALRYGRPDTTASQRMVDVARLRQLRVEIETYADFDTKSACLLYDVCRALDFDQAQVQHVVGPAFWIALDAPIGLTPTAEEEEES